MDGVGRIGEWSGVWAPQRAGNVVIPGPLVGGGEETSSYQSCGLVHLGNDAVLARRASPSNSLPCHSSTAVVP